ncbi:N-6 DNA methylase [Streptosporangium sp. DT93]|uniref:N-6 DNA methylase n=1 Tax=Streptosporangium sp. DT93 TaxID=3393428 RepID=UPI003CEDAC9A
MPPSADPTVSVTLAEIARIAGVGRAAVSNWRRRHDSFPAPVGGTDTSPQFALSQVEQWLRRTGKLDEVGSRERLWPEFEALGDRDAMGAAIAVTGARLLRGETGHAQDAEHPVDPPSAEEAEGLPDGTGLSDAQRSLVERAVGLAGKHGARDTFDFLLGRWLDTHVRQIGVTPAPLAALMAEIAELSREDDAPDARTVLDPACGTGGLLLAAARQWASTPEDAVDAVEDTARDAAESPAENTAENTAESTARTRASAPPLRLLGQDADPTQAALAAVRLLIARQRPGPGTAWEVNVRAGNTLRADPHPDVRADVVLCNPPFNERDWGYEELATDVRWTYGLPPRTEPELAWTQHALSRLAPGGTAVLLMPPGVASRRAGRRIRAGLLRSGVLRAVVALPPGSAPPHSVALHLWVLRTPAAGGTDVGAGVLLVDAADVQAEPPGGAHRTGRTAIDWPLLHRRVVSAVRAGAESDPDDTDDATDATDAADAIHAGRDRPADHAVLPVIDLLDDEVDLTPARHVPRKGASASQGLRRSWDRFGALLDELRDLTATLSALEPGEEEPAGQGSVTVGDLLRAGAVTMRAGQQPADGAVRSGDAPDDAVPVLTVGDVPSGGVPSGWLPAGEASAGEAAGTLTVTVPGEVVVVGAHRAFGAWVGTGPPTVLGPQLFALRVDATLLDPWFLAGCLRAPANARQAGTHASTSSRIDVRRLQVLRLPLDEQRRHGEAFRRLATFERSLREAGAIGVELVDGLTDGLSAGRVPRDRP